MSRLNNLPWMPIYLDAYAGGTTYFTTEQHGAYVLLLMEMWRSDGSLPDKPGMLAAIAKIPPDRWPEIWEVLSPKFISAEQPGRITNARLLHELNDSVAIAEANREKTAAARAAKAKKGEQKAKSLKSGGDSVCDSDCDIAFDGSTVLQSYSSSEEPKGSSGAPAATPADASRKAKPEKRDDWTVMARLLAPTHEGWKAEEKSPPWTRARNSGVRKFRKVEDEIKLCLGEDKRSFLPSVITDLTDAAERMTPAKAGDVGYLIETARGIVNERFGRALSAQPKRRFRIIDRDGQKVRVDIATGEETIMGAAAA